MMNAKTNTPISLPIEPFHLYLQAVRRDALFHAFVAAYLIAGLLTSIVAGVPRKFIPITYSGLLLTTTMPTLLLLTMCALGVRALTERSPLKTFGASLFGPNAMASIILFLSVTVFAGTFVSIKTMLTDVLPFYADPFLASLDRLIHGQDVWRYTAAIFPRGLVTPLGAMYFLGWTVAGWGAVLAVLFIPRLQRLRSQYIWTFMLTWALLGSLVAGAVISAGPIFYNHVTGDEHFEPLATYLSEASPMLAWGRAFLWRSHLGVEGVTGAAISAFPSMHLAQATLIALLAKQINRWAFAGALVFLAVIQFGSVHLGWHYAVDGYFSIIATILIWKVVGATLARRVRN